MEQLVRAVDQLANAIRRRRRALKLTQTELCARSGLRQATISSLESGESGARLKSVMDVLATLDLELVVRERTKGPSIEDIF